MRNTDESLLPQIRKLLNAQDTAGLIKILESPEEDILARRHAVIALGEIGGVKAVEPLIGHCRMKIIYSLMQPPLRFPK